MGEGLETVSLENLVREGFEYGRHLPEFVWVEAKSAAEAYADAFKQLAKPFAYVVRDVAMLIPDGIRYIANGKTAEQKEIQAKKVVSHSVALGELVAMAYGASFMTSCMGGLLVHFNFHNNAVQAVAGSFIGSEATTAAVLFAAYGGLTTLCKMKHARSFGDLQAKRIFTDSVKVVKESVKKGLLSFALADIPVSILLSCFVSPEAAATAGAVAGMVVYTSTMKSSLDRSVDKGYISK